jgi:hypothetical protein
MAVNMALKLIEYKGLVRKSERNVPLGRLRCMWETVLNGFKGWLMGGC